jgi:hypothetical protein
MSECVDLLLDWSRLDEFCLGGDDDGTAAGPEAGLDLDAVAASVPVGDEAAGDEGVAIPAIVLPPVKKRKRVDEDVKAVVAKKTAVVREICAEDRHALMAGLIQWFRECGYALRSHAAPYDDVAQLGYVSVAFVDAKGVRVAVLEREFPKPVCGYTVRIYDRVGRFPVVFVSSAAGVVFELPQVKSVEYLEANAHRFLPQFDLDAWEVRTVFGVVSLGSK